MGFAIAEEVHPLRLGQAPNDRRATRNRGLHLLASVLAIEGGVEVVAVILPLQLAQLVKFVRKLSGLTEQKMRVALRIDDDRVVFVERIGRPLSIDIGLAEPEIFDLHAIDLVAGVSQPDSQHPFHVSFLSAACLAASLAFTSKTSPRLPTSAISMPAKAHRGASRSARRKVPSVSGTTAT